MIFLRTVVLLISILAWIYSIDTILQYYSNENLKGYACLFIWYGGTILTFFFGMMTRLMLRYTTLDGPTIKIFQNIHNTLAVLTISIGNCMILVFFLLFTGWPYLNIIVMLILTIEFVLIWHYFVPEVVALVGLSGIFQWHANYFIVVFSTDRFFTAVFSAMTMGIATERVRTMLNVPIWDYSRVNEVAMIGIAWSSFFIAWNVDAIISGRGTIVHDRLWF